MLPYSLSFSGGGVVVLLGATHSIPFNTNNAAPRQQQHSALSQCVFACRRHSNNILLVYIVSLSSLVFGTITTTLIFFFFFFTIQYVLCLRWCQQEDFRHSLLATTCCIRNYNNDHPLTIPLYGNLLVTKPE
ncbi:hypothetical protein B0T20DRAFT_16693 [Sordaria brevicollis]|uniref:Uncharacterized protein n=1 Tax=Sordaria brevicollis TaxID=83679 RepID=A0AAE0PNE6_SORBR|nr:hypothetical protein B0T20DRAFT_16693 [Sordaria brevicollis]